MKSQDKGDIGLVTGVWVSFSDKNLSQSHLEVVVDLVDMLVDAAVMQVVVQKVVPCILNHCTAKHSQSQVPPAVSAMFSFSG